MNAVCDTAIIGGGIAGSTAAITLAKQGLSVLLIEAKTYPHHKVCGEFLSPACKHTLSKLDVLGTVHSAKPAYISEVIVTSPQGASWSTTFPEVGIGISRYTLDQILMNHAQACDVQVLEGTTVSGIVGDLQKGFTLTARNHGQVERFQAKTVIGAYGKRSSLDRTLHRTFLNRSHPFVALKAHFYGPPLPQRVELHTFAGGYCGLSEVEDGRTNVCLLVRQDIFQSVSAGNINAFIKWMRLQNRLLDCWFSQAASLEQTWHTISQIPFSRKSLVESDILMTGDSAGLIAPLAGDGMEMAFHGGQMAAHAVNHFLEGRWPESTLKQRYTAQWQQMFTPRLRLARWLQSIIMNPHLATLGLRLLNRLPAFGEFIVAHTRDPHLPVDTGEPI